MSNITAGSGQHSHEVPSAIGYRVLMRDGNHRGTEVTRDAGGFFWRSLDWDASAQTERCVLVRLTGVDVNDLQWPFACDLESPDGLALIGCVADDDVPGEVLWDSHAASTAG